MLRIGSEGRGKVSWAMLGEQLLSKRRSANLVDGNVLGVGAVAEELCAGPHIALLEVPHPGAHVHHRACVVKGAQQQRNEQPSPPTGLRTVRSGRTGDVEAGNEG